MPRKTDYSGQRFGRLTALERLGRHNYRFLCDCGKETTGQIHDCKIGRKQSCGCLHKERVSKHGQSGIHTRTHEYNCWNSMKNRCLVATSTAYQHYGGRGVAVCERWMSFENFFADMGVAPSPKHTIDRVDVNGNYEPSNCRWATRKEQSLNRRNNRLVEYNGKYRPVGEWIAVLGLNEELVRSRLKLGWTFDDAVEKPVGHCPAYGGTSHKDIAGQRFGKLKALRKSGTVKRRAMWLCQCDCGTEKIVSGKELRSGRTTSCGCGRRAPRLPRR